MARASNDTSMALMFMAEDLILLADDNTYLERDLKVAVGYGDLLEKRTALTNPAWWEKVWDSNLVKVGLFVAGVEVGRRMVVVK